MCSNATVSFAQQFRLHNPSDASTIDKNVQEEATSFPKVAIRRHLENRMSRLNFEHESLFCLFLFDKAIRETRNRGAANRGKGYENRTLLPCLELAALSIFPFKADICSMGEREGNGATRVKRGEGEDRGKREKEDFYWQGVSVIETLLRGTFASAFSTKAVWGQSACQATKNEQRQGPTEDRRHA